MEDWKFSDFNSIILNKFKNINIDLDQKNKFKFNNYIEDFQHNRIVFLNGFYNNHSFKYEDEENIHFDNLKKGPAYEPKGNNSLNLLNNAFFLDGLLLYIKKGYECKKPLVLYNVINTEKNNNFFNQKILINVEENSKLDLIIYSINLNSVPVFLNTSNFFLVEKYGLLKMFCINDLNNNDLNYRPSPHLLSSLIKYQTKKIDVIFHLAALIGIPYSYKAVKSYIDTNVIGTFNVLNAAFL